MYRRSSLGQLWVILGMAITIVSVSVVFGQILNVPPVEYVPHLASGLVIWAFLRDMLVDGASCYIASQGLIRQLPLSKLTFPIQVATKNLILLAHNFGLVLIASAAVGANINFTLLLFPIGVALSSAILLCLIVPIATFAARFRDLPPIISSIVGVSFYVSPVLWKPESLQPEVAHFLLGLNPLYHLLQIMRLPLTGQAPTLLNWAVSIGMLIVLALVSWVVHKKFSWKIAYWV